MLLLSFRIFQLVTHVNSLAIFETHVMAFSNPTNSIATGQCCQNIISSTCNPGCLTFFEVCLDDLHLKEPNCMFGKNRSKLFHSSSLTINETRLERSIPISTSLSWPVSNVSSTCANVDLLLSCYLIVRRRCWEMFSFCRPNLRLHMMPKGFKSNMEKSRAFIALGNSILSGMWSIVYLCSAPILVEIYDTYCLKTIKLKSAQKLNTSWRSHSWCKHWCRIFLIYVIKYELLLLL